MDTRAVFIFRNHEPFAQFVPFAWCYIIITLVGVVHTKGLSNICIAWHSKETFPSLALSQGMVKATSPFHQPLMCLKAR